MRGWVELWESGELIDFAAQKWTALGSMEQVSEPVVLPVDLTVAIVRPSATHRLAVWSIWCAVMVTKVLEPCVVSPIGRPSAERCADLGFAALKAITSLSGFECTPTPICHQFTSVRPSSVKNELCWTIA